MPLYLNPLYQTRPDGGRTVLIKYDYDPYGEPRFYYAHPLIGIGLSLIDGQRDEEDLVREIEYLFQATPEIARSFVTHIRTHVVDNNEPPLILTSRPTQSTVRPVPRKYEPQDFVVNRDAVDLYSRKLQFPAVVNFIVTNSCSSRCIYCYAERNLSPITAHLPLTRVIELIDEMGENGVLTITFSGGDAFEWPHILPVIERTLRWGIVPMLSTKTYLSEKRCSEFFAVGVRQIQYSLDAATDEKATFMTGRRHFLEQAVASINNLQHAGIDVRVKAVITPYNAAELQALFALVSELGVRQIHLVPYGRSPFRHSDTFFLDEETTASISAQIRVAAGNYPALEIIGFGFPADDLSGNAGAEQAEVDKGKDGHAPHGLVLAMTSVGQLSIDTVEDKRVSDAWADWKRPAKICSMGRTGITILPDGSILMCEQLPTDPRFLAGSVAHRSIRDVWLSAEYSNRTLRPDRELFRGRVCYDCPEFVWCHEVRGRCIRDAFRAYGDAYQPDPHCPSAIPGARLQ